MPRPSMPMASFAPVTLVPRRRGRLTITGRVKDVIIRNMENISATELEHLLHLHPKVRDVAVIGVPDELTGERACAVVVPTDPAAPPRLDELGAHLLAAGLSKRKLPERLELVDALRATRWTRC